MRSIKLALILTMAALMTLGLGSAAFAFHDGGVAECSGCHTMHQNPNDNLLTGPDASSTCLHCHKSAAGDGYHILTDDGSNFKPGGDFYWLSVVNKPAHAGTINGEDRGHSIVASEFFMEEDSNPQSPGGLYPSSALGCSSCHDPHGQVPSGVVIASGSYGDPAPTTAGLTLGNYRLLGMVGYKSHTYGPPTAVTYGMFGPNAERDNKHTDYGSGMSEFCANCHYEMLEAGTGDHTHPAGATNGGFAGLDAIYNSYVATGDMTGTITDSFDHFVPFERGSGATLSSSSTAGPDGNSNVMCLTCHRAHASAFEFALRWQPDETLLADSAYVTANPNAYYGEDIATKYGEWQRSLCNKCHGWD